VRFEGQVNYIMWQSIETRIEENERAQNVPLRASILSVLRNSNMRPGQNATKKMVVLEFGAYERMAWQIDGSAQNFYFHQKWQSRLESAGFTTELFSFEQGKKDGGRHSALSREWSFGVADCIQVKLDTAESMQKLVELLQSEGDALYLDPTAVTRWIEQLHVFFPVLDRFDTPDPSFDSRERDYKLEVAAELRSSLDKATTEEQFAEAIHAVLVKSNLLSWRAYWPMSPKGDGDRTRLWPALRTLAEAAMGDPGEHADALEAFSNEWLEAVPNGKSDPARQIAEFLFLHLAPSDGIYIRHSVRQDFWFEAVGSKFPQHASMADVYHDELRFMQAVMLAFEGHGMAPRDMIDVQSALWVIHNYTDDAEGDAALPIFSRETIEAAMDAYDVYRNSGEHGDVFDGFGEPRDYWVRSTKERPDQVYPTKPIVAFIREKTELNGGWGQKGDAAAQLHNSGFIIIDNDDNPVEPPENYDHLIRDGHRIRLCALNYHIELARDRGAEEVSIRAGDLARDMGLANAVPSICSALNSKKLQQLADVPVPSHTEPNPSSSTVFTYELTTTEGHKPMTSGPLVNSSSATNLILYGPPGTGKTYCTVDRAVSLIDPKFEGDRGETKIAYDAYVASGQIRLITFHQSFSYEDFVEGIKPAANGEGFLTYPIESGIFREICEEANNRTISVPQVGDVEASTVWKMSLGNTQTKNEEIYNECIDESYILLGYGDDLNFTGCDDKHKVSDIFTSNGQEVTNHSFKVSAVHRFKNDIDIGDLVVISEGTKKFRAIGKVMSEYRYLENEDRASYLQCRDVKWIFVSDISLPYERIMDVTFSQMAIYQLSEKALSRARLGKFLANQSQVGDNTNKNFVLIIDEINRGNISRIFGELITLIEDDKRAGCDNEQAVILPYSKQRFSVPANLFLLGTMNTADRSLTGIDIALRRRFQFEEMMPRPELLEPIAGVDLQQMLSVMNDRIEVLMGRDYMIGHSYFIRLGDSSKLDDIAVIFLNKILPLLQEYFFEDWERISWVLNDHRKDNNDMRFVRTVSSKSKSLQHLFGNIDGLNESDGTRWAINTELLLSPKLEAFTQIYSLASEGSD
jgi:hypothetical protein